MINLGYLVAATAGGTTTIETVKTALVNGFTTTAAEIMGVLALIIPVAIGVWTAYMVIRYGKKSFKIVAK